MSNLRWNPYTLLCGDNLRECLPVHFTLDSKVLLIMSKGFDVRMNVTVETLNSLIPGISVECALINFDEGKESSSHEYKDLVDVNMKDLSRIVNEDSIKNFSIKLWQEEGQSKRRVGDRRATSIIDEIDLKKYTDIIVDISALPRGIYFSLIGKLLTLIDAMTESQPNLMVTVAENAMLDQATKDDTPDDLPNFLQGFSGNIDQSSNTGDQPLIWMPILGEGKEHHIRKAYSFLAPSETCPILPFPSQDPRRPDALTISYHSLLFDEFIVEQQNIMYVPEQNPFEAYKILTKAILNYYDSLKPIGECRIVLSTFSSKLLSIGTLLAAYELKSKDIGVGVLNVDSHGYKLDDGIDLQKMKAESKLFLIWLFGAPYSEK